MAAINFLSFTCLGVADFGSGGSSTGATFASILSEMTTNVRKPSTNDMPTSIKYSPSISDVDISVVINTLPLMNVDVSGPPYR